MKRRVYVMKTKNGFVKIGISDDPEKRTKHVASPAGERDIFVVYSQECEDPLEVERRSHAILHSFRKQGEWFYVAPAIAIATVKQAAVDAAEGTKKNAKANIKTSFSAQIRISTWIALQEFLEGTKLSRSEMVDEAIRRYVAQEEKASKR